MNYENIDLTRKTGQF